MSHYRMTPRYGLSGWTGPTSRFGLSGWTDTVGNIGKSIFGVVAAGEQAKGASAALQAQAVANQAMAAQPTIMGFQPMTLLLLGGVGFGAYMLLKKKKSPDKAA